MAVLLETMHLTVQFESKHDLALMLPLKQGVVQRDVLLLQICFYCFDFIKFNIQWYFTISDGNPFFSLSTD